MQRRAGKGWGALRLSVPRAFGHVEEILALAARNCQQHRGCNPVASRREQESIATQARRGHQGGSDYVRQLHS